MDFIEGNWGLEKNEIPLFRSYPGEKINQAALFISGTVEPGPFTIEIIVSNSKRKKYWEKTFQLVAEKRSFHQRIIIPDEISKMGLRKKVDVILTFKTIKPQLYYFDITFVYKFDNTPVHHHLY